MSQLPVSAQAGGGAAGIQTAGPQLGAGVAAGQEYCCQHQREALKLGSLHCTTGVGLLLE